jgi:translocation and assembly module TamB
MKIVRLIKWFLVPPFLLGIVLVSLLATEPGFRLLINLADSLSGPVFSVQRVEGRLLSGWRLENIKIKFEKGEKNLFALKIDSLSCSWRAGQLFKRTLYGEFIRIQGARVWLPVAEKRQHKLPEINLPIRLVINEFLIRDLVVFSLPYPEESSPSFVINEFLVRAEMGGNKLRVEKFKLDSPDFGGELAAGVEFRDNWPLTLDGGWFVVTTDAGRLDGRIGLKGDLKKLFITTQLEKPFIAKVSGEVREVVSDKLNWQMTGTSEKIILNDLGIDLPVEGLLSVAEFSGTLQTYKGFLSAEIKYSDHPQVRVETRVDGDLSGVNISLLHLLVEDSVLSGVGQVDWRDGLSWQANLKGEQLKPELFFAAWLGEIDFNLYSMGQWGDDLSAAFQIERLDGELRGFPVAGTGSMELTNGELVIDNLLLQSGATSFQVHGQAGTELGLSFQAESENLASLLPESGGSFTAKGQVIGNLDTPRITFNLNGSALEFREYSIDRIEVAVDADIGGNTAVEAAIKGGGISGAGEYIDQLLINLTGTQEEHLLVMEVIADLGRLDIGFGGGLKDESWQGKLDKLEFSSEKFGRWHIEQPAILRVGSREAELADFLLQHEQMSFSLAGGWDKQNGWVAGSELKKFSLQLLDKWGVAEPMLDGIVTAGFTARGNGAVFEEAGLIVSLPDLVLTRDAEDGKDRKWVWPENNLVISLDKGEAEINVLSRFEDGSKGELMAVVKNINPDISNLQPKEMFLSGSMETVISDLSFLAPLSDYIVSGSGGVVGNGSLSGTVAAPIFHGKLALVDGEIFVPAVNISVDDLELTVSGDGRNNAVEILAASGDGRITVAGEVNKSDDKQWLADIVVGGERFKIVNLDEYQAEISPDLRLLYSKEDGVFIKGTVAVPMAYIAPQEFQRGAVTSSADVVVIDYEGQEPQKNKLPLSFDLVIDLGEDVKIDGFGLQGQLAGRLGLVGSPGKVVTAFGNLNLRDAIFIFSDAELEIKRGLIFYQGGAVSNPGFDIQAEREISGKEVGVLITGTASRMEFNLFSNPPMDDSDILSYIVTGKEMSTGGGEGAMIKAAAASLGKWTGGKITDEIEGITGLDIDLAGNGEDGGLSLVVGREIVDGLYISYGRDITSSLGTFKARYDLDWGLSLETESSAEESGVDLFWSWER